MKNELDILIDEDNIVSEENINLIEQIYSLIPKNKTRPINKLLFYDEYFNLEFSKLNNKIKIEHNPKNIVFSKIKDDHCRKYIEKMAYLYINNPKKITNFLINQKELICEYIKLSNPKNGYTVEDCFKNIINNPLMAIQIAGRIFQHYDSSIYWIEEEKSKKFLYYENIETGNQQYIYQLLIFIVKTNIYFSQLKDKGINFNILPRVFIGDIFDKKNNIINNLNLINQNIDNKLKFPILPIEIKQNDSSSVFLKNINDTSKIYPYLNCLNKRNIFNPIIQNNNKINVVSDTHIFLENNFPFINDNFNIIAGDIIDKITYLPDLNGICVIGNHEILTLTSKIWNSPKNLITEDEKNFFSKIEPHIDTIKSLFNESKDEDNFWWNMPMGDHEIFKIYKDELQKCVPNLKVLNNEYYIKDNIRYIGLTIPIRHILKKKILQDFIEKELTRLLNNDQEIKTIIISHAPLFNELSLLTRDKGAYNKEYNCENQKIIDLFKKFNIIGVIHGHHHIPATQGRYRFTNFAGKKLFVICSIYSRLNSGIDLTKFIIDDNNQNTKKEFIKLNDNELQSIKKIININFDYLFNENKKIKPKKVKIKKEVKEKIIIDKFKTYSYDDKIEEIKGLTEEFSKTQNDYIYVLDKRINGIRFKKRFLNKNDAIDELNKIIINSKNNTI